MKRRIVICVIVCLMALSLVAAAAGNTIWLKANQSVTARCVDPTGEIAVTFIDDGEVEITCRVWVDSGR